MQSLICHPDRPFEAELSVAADAARSPSGLLTLNYKVAGRTDLLLLPPASAPARADELWRHTCFEAFVRASSGETYYEFNFAPSLQWAAYRFQAYRAGMGRAEGIPPPECEARTPDDAYRLKVAVDLAGVKELPTDMPWRLGLCAVVEEASGRMSYWALSHPRGRPDFHHSDCFALELPKP